MEMIPKKKLKRLTKDGIESDFIYSLRTVEFTVEYDYEELMNQLREYRTPIYNGWEDVNNTLGNQTTYYTSLHMGTTSTSDTIISTDVIGDTQHITITHKPTRSLSNINVDFNITSVNDTCYTPRFLDEL